MGKLRRLSKNTILILIGNLGSKLVYLLLLPLCTRWLSTSDYGSVDLMSVYATLLLGIISCCIHEAIFLFPKRCTDEYKSIYFSSAIAFSIGVIVLYIIFCTTLSLGKRCWEGFFIEHIWSIFGMMAVSFVQILVQQFVRAIDKIVVYSVTGIVQTLGITIFSFLLLPRFGVQGYVLAVICGGVTATVYSVIFSRAYRFIDIHGIRKSALMELLRYSIPLIPNGIMWFLLGTLNRPLLEHYAGLESVGIFAVANRLAGTGTIIFSIFSQAWTISAVEEFKAKNFHAFYNRILKLITIFQILVVAALIIASKYVIELLTTFDYFSAYLYVPLLAVSVLFSNIAAFVGVNFSLVNKSKYFFYSTLWAGLSSVILNFMLIPGFSIWGACCSLLISQIINAAFRIRYSWKIVPITNVPFYLKNILLLFCLAITRMLVHEKTYWLVFLIIYASLFYFVNKRYLSMVVLKVRDRLPFYTNRF